MDRIAFELGKFVSEQQELELIVLRHFQKWKSHACQCLSDDEIQQLDWIDEFSKDIRKQLLKLEQQGKLKDC